MRLWRFAAIPSWVGFLALLFLGFGSAQSQESKLVTSWSPSGTIGDSVGVSGVCFQVGAKDISVTAVGVLVANVPGYGSHEARIYDANDNLVAAGTLNLGGAPAGELFTNLATPVTLTAGQKYYLLFDIHYDSVYDYASAGENGIASDVTVLDQVSIASGWTGTRFGWVADWGAAASYRNGTAAGVTFKYTLPDTTLPTVAITAPTVGASVSGPVTITADASDNVGVVGVQFVLDDSDLGADVTASLWQFSWDTTTVSDGSHTLKAVARDAAGNRATSAVVQVTVSNSPAESKLISAWAAGGNVGNYAKVLGTYFQVGSKNIIVTALGVNVANTSGSSNTRELRIYDEADHLVASAPINLTVTSPGEVFTPLATPVTLSAGQKYYLLLNVIYDPVYDFAAAASGGVSSDVNILDQVEINSGWTGARFGWVTNTGASQSYRNGTALGLTFKYMPAQASSNLIGWWKLDEGLGTAANDSSSGRHAGTLFTGATWTGGHIGSHAVAFDGSAGYIDQPATLSGARTISFWMNSNAAVNYPMTLSNTRGILSKWGYLSGDTSVRYVSGSVATPNTGGEMLSGDNTFESSLGNWVYANGAWTARDASTSHGGAGSLQIGYDGSGSGDCYHRGLTITNGHLYKLSFWAKGDAPRTVWFGGAEWSSWQGIGFDGTYEVTTAWKQYDFYFYATKTTSEGYISFTGNHGGSPYSLWLDDISLTEVVGDSATVTNGEWTHYVIVSGAAFDANAMAFGKYGGYLNGALDDIRVYNRVLSAEEIAALYADGNSGGTAPTITVQPQSQTATVGDNVTFSVTATGNPAPAYQWLKNGSAVAGWTNASFTMVGVTSNDNATYSVVVTNSAGSVTSAGATLVVQNPATPPTITAQPQGQTVTAGRNVTFSVVATGNPAPSYQWRKNGGNITGENGSTLTLTSVTTGDAGDYTVSVSNSAGSVISTPATLVVTQPVPALAHLSDNFSGTQGVNGWEYGYLTTPQNAATFSTVSMTYDPSDNIWVGTEPFRTPIVGPSGAHPGVDSHGGVYYSAVARWTSNFAGTVSIKVQGEVASNLGGTIVYIHRNSQVLGSLTLPGGYGPGAKTLTAVPLAVGDKVTFELNAGDNPGYDWTSLDLTITAESAAVAPTITTQPQGRTATTGETVTFTVTATGTPAPTYQWKKNGSAVSGGTNASLTLASVTTNDSASYTVDVGNLAGSVTSAAAVLTVQNPSVAPTITTQPQSVEVTAGTAVNFTVVATANPAPTYQWQKNGYPISGATSAGYAIQAAQTADAGYYAVVVTNSQGTATSSSALLTVNPPPSAPTISTQPQGLATTVGQNVTLVVSATGYPAPSYQWKKDGTAIAGATNTFLALNGVQLSSSGDYVVVVSNTAGTATSSVARLTVQPALTRPSITSQPASININPGDTASFTVGATGNPAPTYQWSKDGVNLVNGGRISGATSGTLTITGAQGADIGQYTVTVSNSQGSASVAASLSMPPVDNIAWELVELPGIFDFRNVVATPGSYTLLAIRITNTGTTTWIPGQYWVRSTGADGTTKSTFMSWPAAGDVPPGYSASTFITIDTPNAYQRYTFSAIGPNGQFGPTVERGLNLAASSPITSDNLLITNVGTTGTYQITSSTSVIEYLFEWVNLAPGFTRFNPVSGKVTLTPTVAGSYYFNVGTADFNGTPKKLITFVAGGTDPIYSVGTATGVVGANFGAFYIHPTNQPAIYTVTGSVPGLQYDSARHMFYGTPSAAGSYPVSVTARTPTGTVTLNATINIDATANVPTAPTSVRASNVTSNSCTLSWDPSTPNSSLAIAKYEIERDGFNGVAVSGTTTQVNNVTLPAGQTTVFRVRAVDNLDHASAWSSPLSITVGGVAPAIQTQPVSQSVLEGGSITLSVTATGAPSPSYQWQKDGVDIPGANGSSYTIANAAPSQAGGYSVVVSNGSGRVTSVVAGVAVIPLTNSITILRQPQSETTAPGGNVVFMVDASGPGNLRYQWRKNGSAIQDQTTNNLVLLGVGSADVADYDVIVSNESGYVGSNVVHLTLDPAYQKITFYPLPNRSKYDVPFTLRGLASSGLPLTFEIVNASPAGLASIDGNVLSLNAGVTLGKTVGKVTVRASQPGGQASSGNTFNAATPVERTFSVVEAAPPGTVFPASGQHPPVGSAQSVGYDVDHDGYTDEIIPLGVQGFGMHISGVTVIGGISWSPFFIDDPSYADDVYGGNNYFINLDSDPLVLVDMDFTFTPDPDYQYIIFEEWDHSNGDTVANWGEQYKRLKRIGEVHTAEAGHAQVTVPGRSIPFELFLGETFYLIRDGKPLGMTQATLPGGDTITFGTGSGAGRITLPGGLDLTLSTNAEGTSTAMLPRPSGGPVYIEFGKSTYFAAGPSYVPTWISSTPVTIPGTNATIAVSNGVGTLTVPGIGTIRVNITGGGSVVLDSGAGVSVSNDGKVSLILPPGTAPTVLQAVNILGQVVQGGSISLGSVLPLPTSVWDVRVTADGKVQVGRKISDGETLWFDIYSPSVDASLTALVSRDRFLTGTIDISDRLSDVSLEFVNTTTGQNLGTFPIKGTAKSFIYNSEDEILSDSELDSVIDGTLDTGSPQLSQQVVFWRASADSTAVNFSTVFEAVGDIEIRIRKGDGSLLSTIRRTLTAEPNFGGLLAQLANRISSLEMPVVQDWALLPSLQAIDDDDEDFPAAASITRRAEALRNEPTLTRVVRAEDVAVSGHKNNFLIKIATIANKAIGLAETTGIYYLKINGGFIKGYIDGVWDGLKSDATGIAELGKMAGDGLRFDFNRAKTMWDGVKKLFELDAAGREALFDSIMIKFVQRATVDVPWTPAGTNADEWGASAYMSGYCGGFATEQVIAVSVGAGLVSKAGTAMKVALSGTRLGEITASMVGNVRRFTTGAFLAAAKPVSTYGSEALRAARKAIDDVAKLALNQASSVGEEIAIMMDRLGVPKITYQKVADDLAFACSSADDWLKIGITGHVRLAAISAGLGAYLTESGVRGFLNLWKGALRKGATGDYVGHLLYVFSPNGILDKQGLAKVLEMFDDLGSSSFKFTRDSIGRWKSPAGIIYDFDQKQGSRILHVLNHTVEDAGRAATNKPHGVFTMPREQLFEFLDYVWTNWDNLPKVPVLGQTNPTYRISFQEFIGKADNAVGTTGRQAIGYTPTKTMRIAIERDGTMYTAFPENI